jgi:hypothetical protein
MLLMRTYSLSHLSNPNLLEEYGKWLGRERADSAIVLAHLGEVDARRLYLAAGYSSMFAFCVEAQHFSEQAAYKRIHAARVARRFPVLFEALAEGRIHLSGIVLLASHLTPENVSELLAAATHQSKAKIEVMLAARFPRPDVATRLVALPVRTSAPVPPEEPLPLAQLSPGKVEAPQEPAPVADATPPPVIRALVEAPARRAQVTPLAPQRFAFRATLDQETHDLLRQAQALLSHAIPTGDEVQVLRRVLQIAVGELQRRKFAVTERPRQSRVKSTRPRYVPAAVKRAVWERDGRQCTYVSPAGHRCTERYFLELDHIDPVARGGRATADSLRLRCRAHNQLEAERVFGAAFMNRKREASARAPIKGQSRGTAGPQAHGATAGL